MSHYDAGLFRPAAPVAYVSLSNPINGLRVDSVMMLIDTGSDATAVPKSVCDATDAEDVFTVELELVDGKPSTLNGTRLRLEWGRYTVNGEFLVTETTFGIIGRDILNRIRIRFDGPAQTWSFD